MQKELKGRPFAAWYRDVYLYSAHWQELRAKKLAAHKLCQRCGFRVAVEAHHRNYNAIFDVEEKDLEALCRTCHAANHGRTPSFREEEGAAPRGFLKHSCFEATHGKPRQELRELVKKLDGEISAAGLRKTLPRELR